MASSASSLPLSFVEAEDAYFSSNPPPRALAHHQRQTTDFIDAHKDHRRVVLVTSGGTTVPLEKQTVRFIDNFSAGTRGATSAEHFLESGYAVIFLHRQFSLLPFVRHVPQERFLDLLTEGLAAVDDDATDTHRDATGVISEDAENSTTSRTARSTNLPRNVLDRYRRAKAGNLLLMIPFVTIGDYLHELRAIARLMRPLGRNGLLYLAAAVSDFFVPPERMAEHKIQSTDAVSGTGEELFDNFDASPAVPRSKRLVIDLDPVPKFLKNLVDGWAPQGMIASYKLETDPTILVRKARYSLDRYQHHLVIGNLLSTRKWEVVFVSPGRADAWLRVPRAAGWGDAEGRPLRADELPDEDPDMEIEKLIIPAVAELHDAHVAAGEGPNKEAGVVA